MDYILAENNTGFQRIKVEMLIVFLISMDCATKGAGSTCILSENDKYKLGMTELLY